MNMKTFDIEKKLLDLGTILALVEQNHEIILTAGNTPIARLSQWIESDKNHLNNTAPKVPQPGLHPGAIWMSEDFDEPLSDAFWLGEE